MKRLFLAILTGLSFSAVSQVDTISNLSPAEKIVGLSKFWSEAANNFAYFDRVPVS